MRVSLNCPSPVPQSTPEITKGKFKITTKTIIFFSHSSQL
jgi:hypothetical protein